MRAREFTEPTAAGCILYAEDTGRWGLQQRSDTVGDPGVWAAWGGGREPGESLEQCVLRELAEESGYRGPIKLEPLSKNAKYATFIGIVPQEFEPRPCDEWKDFCWVELGHWPNPLHPGVAAALGNVYIKENFLANNTMEGSNESLASMVGQDQVERNEYKNFVKSQAGGDWSRGAKMYAQLKKRPSDDIFGDAMRLNQFMKMKFDFDKFTDKDWNNYWLLAQHCDTDRNFQKQALSIIKKYQGSNSLHYKYLYDRISVGLTGKQKYGTQNADSKQGVAENFADGKVKGKSRPGRVKRSGASCAGSVTDLRARAKKYGGERGKMYHWCANMKSGRKKTNEATVGSLTIGPFEIVVDDHSFERAVQREINTSDIDNTLRKIKLPRVAKQMLNFETGSRFYIFDHSNNVALGLRRIGQNRFVLKTVYNGKPMDLNIAGIITI